MSVRASMLRSEFPPYLKGGRPSCAHPPAQGGRAPPPAQAVRSPAAPPPVSGEQIFELRLTDQVQTILLMAAAASGLTPAEVIARAIPFYASEAVGMPALLGDVTRVPDGEGGR